MHFLFLIHSFPYIPLGVASAFRINVKGGGAKGGVGGFCVVVVGHFGVCAVGNGRVGDACATLKVSLFLFLGLAHFLGPVFVLITHILPHRIYWV